MFLPSKSSPIWLLSYLGWPSPYLNSPLFSITKYVFSLKFQRAPNSLDVLTSFRPLWYPNVWLSSIQSCSSLLGGSAPNLRSLCSHWLLSMPQYLKQPLSQFSTQCDYINFCYIEKDVLSHNHLQYSFSHQIFEPSIVPIFIIIFKTPFPIKYPNRPLFPFSRESSPASTQIPFYLWFVV